MPTLQETDNEYLLAINYYQRDRAKGIAGRKWDPDTRCWIYPRNEETYAALMGEFEGEFQGIIPDPPITSDQTIKEINANKLQKVLDEVLNKSKNKYSEIIDELNNKNQEIEKSNKRLIKENKVLRNQENDFLSFQVSHFSRLIENILFLIDIFPIEFVEDDENDQYTAFGMADVIERLDEGKKLLFDKKSIDLKFLNKIEIWIEFIFETFGIYSETIRSEKKKDELQAQISDLEQKIQQDSNNRDQLTNQMADEEKNDNKSELQDIFNFAGGVAFQVAKDPIFIDLSKNIRANPYRSTEIEKLIKEKFRQILVADPYLSFYDILDQAQEKKIVSREAISMAQTVRITRNILAHNNPSMDSIIALSTIELLAAALVWKELPTPILESRENNGRI